MGSESSASKSIGKQHLLKIFCKTSFKIMISKISCVALLAIFAHSSRARPDGIKFGSSEENVNTRLGLLGTTHLGLGALGQSSSGAASASSAALTDGTSGNNELVGRVPSAPSPA